MRTALRSVTLSLTASLTFLGIAAISATNVHAEDLKAKASTFVGKLGDCGTGYAAGSQIVTAKWLDGLGLPDNGGQNSNPGDPTNNPNKKDDHEGLLLSKNGPTPDCSAAGAVIQGVRGTVITPGFTLGFDVRNGGHCGAGAPRFNVSTDDGNFSFVGACSNATLSPAPQDPTAWTRARMDVTNPANAFPVLVPGSKITHLEIIFDEGTDEAGGGLVVIDNIFVNGRYIREGDDDND